MVKCYYYTTLMIGLITFQEIIIFLLNCVSIRSKLNYFFLAFYLKNDLFNLQKKHIKLFHMFLKQVVNLSC